ncbi:precorrin-2 dehydrogenase/sirohydrochlorin ferrochelatase family protein [Sphingomonas prati]|uniref:precorrin-2 dehydrogenase/sirohydrochlorin ferrochelatase family protein n=1 Tax=Sphingomonas prati TaxID=1843237 RepID=UPI0012F6567F|nr:NAD(P)-dependent oxidoreductase [Sphingomonas prati]
MHSLPILLRLSSRPVILLGEGGAADAKRRILTRAGAVPVGEDAAAALAIVAIEDADEATAAVARLRARGILVNAVDRPALCDFTLPAIVERGAVLVAIGTGGASAGLAKALRQRLEMLLPADLGTLADGLFAARGAVKARWPENDVRRRAIDAALAPGGLLDPLTAGGAERIAGWVAAGDAGAELGNVAIRLRSGDPDDLTLREARWLGGADVVRHAADVPAAILARIRADADVAVGSGEDVAADGLIVDLRFAEAAPAQACFGRACKVADRFAALSVGGDEQEVA